MTIPLTQPAWDWALVWSNLEKIALAFVISLPLGFENEKEVHRAGVRTFPIVAMASCGYMLLALELKGDLAATSRVLQGLITGIGFVGGGAILKEALTVQGTATAASILNVGAVGAAVALGRYEIALTLSLLNVLTLHLLIPLKKLLGGSDESS